MDSVHRASLGLDTYSFAHGVKLSIRLEGSLGYIGLCHTSAWASQGLWNYITNGINYPIENRTAYQALRPWPRKPLETGVVSLIIMKLK